MQNQDEVQISILLALVMPIYRLPLATNRRIQGPAIPQVEFTDNDISMAFKIVSDATGWSIFPTADAGKAKISLWAKNVSAGELLDTVVTMAGLIYHRQGNVITVMTYDEYMQYYGLAKKVFTLKYASAAPLEAAIKPFLTKQGKSVIHKETNTIVLYDTNANIQFITTVIDKLDTPADNICAEVINLKYANSENLVKMLQAAFANQKQIFRNKSVNTVGNEPNRTTANLELPYDQVEIYSVDQANQLVVIGLKSDIEKIKDLVKMVDVYGDNMVIEVIDLKYADSDVIAEALQQLFGDNASKEGAAKDYFRKSRLLQFRLNKTSFQAHKVVTLFSARSPRLASVPSAGPINW